MTRLAQLKCAAAMSALLVSSTAVHAAETIIPQSSLVASTGYYTNSLGAVSVTTGGGNAAGVGDPSGRNDDGFNGPVTLGFNFTLYGTTYDTVYINNNGNVSFGNGISAFVPNGPTGAAQPVISPWFSDVDTRGAASGVVHYQLDTPGQLVVTWDDVGSYNSNDSALDSFQLVLRGDDYTVPNGEGQIGFFYKNMDWQANASTALAAIGFGDGLGNSEVLEGSSSQLNLNSVVADHHVWFDQNLVVVPPSGAVPEPASWAMFIGGFGMIGGAMRRRSRKLAASFA